MTPPTCEPTVPTLCRRPISPPVERADRFIFRTIVAHWSLVDRHLSGVSAGILAPAGWAVYTD
jgi:hypothetical protein